MKHIPRAFRYLKPYRRLAVLSGLLILLASAVGLLVPWPLKVLIDHVLQDVPLPAALAPILGHLADHRSMLLVVAVISGLALTVLQNAITVLDSFVNTKLEQKMVLDVRSDMFQHSQRLSIAFHDQRRSGMLIYAINFQGDAVARLVMAIPALVQSFLTLIGMFWISYHMDWQLALVSLTVVPVLYYSVCYYMTHIQTRLQEVRAMEGESLSIIHEAVSMLRVIVAFGREGHEYDRFRKQVNRR